MRSTLANFVSITKFRDARRLLVADAISKAGDWVLFVAMSALLFHAGGAAALALFSAMRIAVPVAIGPWAGRWGAEWSAKRVMIAADAGRGLLLAVAAVIASTSRSPWLLQLPVLACVVLGAWYSPAERRFQRDAVAPAQRSDFNSVIGATGSTIMIVAPALGGVLLATVGTVPALVIDSVSFGVSVVLVATVRPRNGTATGTTDPAGQATSTTAGVRTGALRTAFGVLRRDRFVRAAVITQTAACTVAGAVLVMFAPLASRLSAGDAAIGWFGAAIGFGSLIGVVLGNAVARGERLVLGVGSIVMMGPVLGLFASSPHLLVALVLALTAGVLANLPEPLYWTSYADRVPEATSGPFYGLVESGIAGGFAGGGALVGAATAAFGPVAAGWLVGAGGAVAAGIALVMALREHMSAGTGVGSATPSRRHDLRSTDDHVMSAA